MADVGKQLFLISLSKSLNHNAMQLRATQSNKLTNKSRETDKNICRLSWSSQMQQLNATFSSPNLFPTQEVLNATFPFMPFAWQGWWWWWGGWGWCSGETRHGSSHQPVKLEIPAHHASKCLHFTGASTLCRPHADPFPFQIHIQRQRQRHHASKGLHLIGSTLCGPLAASFLFKCIKKV